jgi:hypothetical protein
VLLTQEEKNARNCPLNALPEALPFLLNGKQEIIYLAEKKKFFKFCFLFIKGIVSRDFGTLFLISLDKFEGRNRAG